MLSFFSPIRDTYFPAHIAERVVGLLCGVSPSPTTTRFHLLVSYVGKRSEAC